MLTIQGSKLNILVANVSLSLKTEKKINIFKCFEADSKFVDLYRSKTLSLILFLSPEK